MKLFTISTLISMASAVFGPIPLFSAISSTTFSQDDFQVKPYLNVKNGSTIVGIFNEYVIENDTYSYQLYNSEDSSLKLYIVCGDNEYFGPVSQPQLNEYEAILELPAACKVDFKVGNEIISCAASSSSSIVAIILGSIGISGGTIVVIMQVIKAIRTKGGISNLLKGKVNTALNDALKNVPLSNEIKNTITSQAESIIEKIDDTLDQKLTGVRGEENNEEAIKNLIGLITKQPEVVVVTTEETDK
jgi:hypothetical protein